MEPCPCQLFGRLGSRGPLAARRVCDSATSYCGPSTMTVRAMPHVPAVGVPDGVTPAVAVSVAVAIAVLLRWCQRGWTAPGRQRPHIR